jgi:hypothetical protein
LIEPALVPRGGGRAGGGDGAKAERGRTSRTGRWGERSERTFVASTPKLHAVPARTGSVRPGEDSSRRVEMDEMTTDEPGMARVPLSQALYCRCFRYDPLAQIQLRRVTEA